MFEALGQRLSSIFSGLRGKVSDSDLIEFTAQIKTALLESDVALEVAESFSTKVLEKCKSQSDEINKSTNPAARIFEIVNTELTQILGGSARRLQFAKTAPTVILLTGLQGAGKTSLAGKLAYYLKSQGNTPLLVASDLQRPNAVTQLQVVGDSIKVPVFAPEPGNGVGDPISVAKAGVKFAKDKLHNFVIIDTAGRLAVDEAMMDEITAIRNAVQPQEILFVVDSMTGQDAVNTAKAFNDKLDFTGIVLTKLDGDTRGGAAISITYTVNKPIKFTSNGEKLETLDIFYPDRMAQRILGMGDITTLVERAQEQFDEAESKKLEAKIRKNKFDFADFKMQLEQLKKMGNMKDMLSMIPGVGSKVKDLDIDENAFKGIESMINSMTPAERADPDLIDMSRKKRIAKGSGKDMQEVNNFLKQFAQMRDMMKNMNKLGAFGKMMPGMRR